MSDFLPDFRQVRTFVAIMQAGSFTLAAKNLRLTQSAISHSLRSLEDQLGCRLLDRMGKKIVPTREGEVFYKHAMLILDALTNAARECDKMKNSGQSRLRIGAPKSLCTRLIPDALREFCDSFPNCKISLVTEDTRVLLDLMHHHELDMVIGIVSGDQENACHQSLFQDQLSLVVAPGHPWVGMDHIPAGELSKTSIICYSRSTSTHQLVEKAFRKQNISMERLIEIHDMEVIKEMVRAGLGVGILADWQVKKESMNQELQVISIAPFLGQPLLREWGVFLPEGRIPSLDEEVFIGITMMLAEHFSVAYED